MVHNEILTYLRNTMENRRNSRREGGRSGRSNDRRDNRDNRRGNERDNERHGFSNSGRNNDDYDFERKERRRSMRNDNWFDIDPSESRRNEREERDSSRRNSRNEDRRDNRRYNGTNDSFDERHSPKRTSLRNDSRDDRHERKYRDYKKRSYRSHDNDEFDEFDENEYFDTPRQKRGTFRNGRSDRRQDDSRFQDRERAPRRDRNEEPQPAKKNDGSTRLNKYISNAGICSRREADVLIASGAVSVNGEVVTQLGFKVMPGDVVHYGGEKLVSERKRYVLLNKPKGYITTMDDPQERKTVMNLVADACTERIYPVGRLDRNTTGLLLFTNDGELAKKLSHPSTGARKVYHVELDKPLTANDRKRMLEGLSLEDGEIAVDAVEYDGDDRHCVGVEIHSGRNRIVRRIFESMGYEVYKLDRVIFAELTKKNLSRGRWRMLTDKEVAFLKML